MCIHILEAYSTLAVCWRCSCNGIHVLQRNVPHPVDRMIGLRYLEQVQTGSDSTLHVDVDRATHRALGASNRMGQGLLEAGYGFRCAEK